MKATHTPRVRQRAELTYKYNLQSGRHGWLRLTPAYSIKVVKDVLAATPGATRVFDPFSGTATTTLCAAERGLVAHSIDINPFLVWLGNAKLAAYTPAQLDEVARLGDAAARAATCAGAKAVAPPPLHRIDRWWSPEALRFLCALKAELEHRAGDDARCRDLLMIAFCKTMMRLSNADFGHQSMSFKDRQKRTSAQPELDARPDFRQVFAADLTTIVDSASPPPTGSGQVLSSDSRTLDALDLGAEPDLLITSPPYPNRMSYIRELRPYLYWLGYLQQSREAGELDWQAIGGTWGIATSRLACWERDDAVAMPAYLAPILDKIRAAHGKNGPLMANYVSKYFEDMARHLERVRGLLAPGADVHYIIGNSSFYGHLVPAERLYADLMTDLGYRNVGVRVLRKRNSKKELYEFDVFATR